MMTGNKALSSRQTLFVVFSRNSIRGTRCLDLLFASRDKAKWSKRGAPGLTNAARWGDFAMYFAFDFK